ncbi:DUF7494 domain-containing protein [Helicobacter cynogastricus]|uniref:DUF7494 domain-containing protein n=1 Tax=Helicobacter cynogastricus TaxID=329937 RepID=UPI001F15C8DC|nr:outer membrane protein assembly factor BamD [Helicobacter cynogastricus]
MLFLVLLCTPLFALTFSITQGKEEDQDFATLTLKNDSPFTCTQNPIPPTTITCVIHSIPKPGFTPMNTAFFNISYDIKNYVFYLYIKPKFQQQLFALPHDYKRHIPIQNLPIKTSDTWQIVGFTNKIPFLTSKDSAQESYKGLDFPILIEDAQTPYIQELGVDNKPLNYSKGADLDGYLQVKKLMGEQSYLAALKAIGSIFETYPNTLFRKDLYLYEMIALDKLNKRQDLLLQIGERWLKLYPADPEVPHVLYLMGTAYDHINHARQAQNHFERAIIEYPQSRYAPLSQMRLAEQSANEGNNSGALTLFQKAYSAAKDIESASLIAFSWARFDLNTYGGKNAPILVHKILEANPNFFLHYPIQSYEFLTNLKTHALFAPAIAIAKILSDQDNDPSIKEKAAFDLGFLYAKNNQPNEAHVANLEYLDNFNNVARISLVKQRDNEVLFLMHGSFEEKLARFNQILKDYPAGSNEHKKALDYKAQMLLEERYYSQVLGMAPDLPMDSEPMQQALLALGRNAVKEGDCKSAVDYLVQVVPLQPDAFTQEEQLEAFDCLYNAKLYNQAEVFAKNGLQKSPENPEKRIDWLYRQGNNLYKLDNFQDSLLAAKDAFTLATLKKAKRYYDIGFVLFADYMRTNNPTQALDLFPKLQKWFKDDKRMIDVYGLLLQNEAKTTNNPTTLQLYATNLIALQKTHQNDSFTPYAQQQLISALMREGKLDRALQENQALLKESLDSQERQHALYMQGSILKQQNKIQESQKAFSACLAIKNTSAWKDLCQQALNLLQP